MGLILPFPKAQKFLVVTKSTIRIRNLLTKHVKKLDKMLSERCKKKLVLSSRKNEVKQ